MLASTFCKVSFMELLSALLLATYCSSNPVSQSVSTFSKLRLSVLMLLLDSQLLAMILFALVIDTTLPVCF